MTRKIKVFLAVLVLGLLMTSGVAALTSYLTVEVKETNGEVLIVCAQPDLDEVIVTPYGDNEVKVICRTYMESDE